MAGVPRYVVTQDVPPAIPLSTGGRPGSRTVQIVPPSGGPLVARPAPVAVAVPAAVAQRAAAAPSSPGVVARAAQAVGDWARAAFPQSYAMGNTVDVDRAVSEGNYGKAIGGAAVNAVARVPGLVNDVLAPVGQAIAAVGKPVLGIADDAILPAAAAPARANPVDQALAQGRTAPETPITPQDALGNVITRALSNGASFNEIKELGALVPAAVKPTGTAKDRATAVASSIADTQYAAQLAAAEKLEGEARDKARADATKAYLQQYSALAGVNQQGLALAQQLAGSE